MTKFNFLKGAAALALAAAPLASAHAGDAEGRYAVKGAGLIPCSAFVQQLQEQKPEAALTMSWLAGYLSASNMLIPETYDLVSWQGDGVLTQVLASICAQMPERPVAVAAAQLIPALGGQRIATAEQPKQITVGENQRVLYPSVIKQIQQTLRDQGRSIVVDGDFGPGSQTALKAFQKSAGIPETGFPDTRTMILLFAGGQQGQGNAGPVPAQTQQPAPAQPQATPEIPDSLKAFEPQGLKPQKKN